MQQACSHADAHSECAQSVVLFAAVNVSPSGSLHSPETTRQQSWRAKFQYGVVSMHELDA